MSNTNDEKGKGTQLRKQVDALNETIGTKLVAIKACYDSGSQELTDDVMTAILLQDAAERFSRELEIILKLA